MKITLQGLKKIANREKKGARGKNRSTVHAFKKNKNNEPRFWVNIFKITHFECFVACNFRGLDANRKNRENKAPVGKTHSTVFRKLFDGFKSWFLLIVAGSFGVNRNKTLPYPP